MKNTKITTAFLITFLVHFSPGLLSFSHASDGTVIGNLTASMNKGQWTELTGMSGTSVISASDSLFEYTHGGVWDPITKTFYFAGTSDPNGSNSDGKFIKYEAATNAWSEIGDPPFMFSPPAVMHAYDHHAIDSTGRNLYYMPFSVTGQLWKYRLPSGPWTQLNAALGGNMIFVSQAHATEFFPERNSVLVYSAECGQAVDSTLSCLREYNLGNGSWSDLGGLLPQPSNLHPFSEYNPVHHIMWFGGGDGSKTTYILQSNGSITPAPGTVPSVINDLGTRSDSALITVDPASGDYLVWTDPDGLGGNGSGSFHSYNPISGTWTLLATGSQIPPWVGTPSPEAVTFHASVVPMSNYGVIMFAQWRPNGTRVWLYKHGAGGSSPPPPPPPPPPPSSGTMTFNEICNLSTTINCWGFESQNEIFYARGHLSPSPCDNTPFILNHINGNNDFGFSRQSWGNTTVVEAPAGQCNYPQIDSTVKTSGNSSLKFTVPSGSGQGTSGDFIAVFKRIGNPPNSTFGMFGPGSDFWVRWSERDNAALITNKYQRKSGGAQGGVKRVIIHGVRSSGGNETTIQDTDQREIIQAYGDQGSDIHDEAQGNIGCFANTNNHPNINSPLNYPEPPCRKWKANQWVTYHVHIIIPNPVSRPGTVEVYINEETTPIIRSTNVTMDTVTSPPGWTTNNTWDPAGNNEGGYGQFSFTLFATDKLPGESHPQGAMWIDDIVVSRTRVPPISGTSSSPGDTSPPSPPTGLTAVPIN